MVKCTYVTITTMLGMRMIVRYERLIRSIIGRICILIGVTLPRILNHFQPNRVFLFLTNFSSKEI